MSYATPPGPDRGQVAVVGSGVAGLTAAHLLQRRFDVTLFESDDRLGGHAHTHDVPTAGGGLAAVDSGFIVHNERTYPNLLRLFAELGVRTQPTEMSMSVRCEGCGLEYAGARGPRGVFAQRRRLSDPRFWGFLTQIRRFHRAALRVLEDPRSAGEEIDELTLGAFLAAEGFSRHFAEHFVVPLVSAVWSSGTGDALGYPARYLFRFLHNHGMLAVRGSPQWHTVTDGSRTYVERAAKHLTAVRTATPVRSVERHSESVTVRADDGSAPSFDHVVVATHAGQALSLLADPTAPEREILGAFRTSRNDVVLHSDTAMMPRTPHAWASWNYTVTGCGHSAPRDGQRAIVTYDMNRLQRLGESAGGSTYLVSMGAAGRVREDAVLARMVYEHPVHTAGSVAAQRRFEELTSGRVQLAGAWQGWGFHEDGCASGVRAAARLGVDW